MEGPPDQRSISLQYSETGSRSSKHAIGHGQCRGKVKLKCVSGNLTLNSLDWARRACINKGEILNFQESHLKSIETHFKPQTNRETIGNQNRGLPPTYCNQIPGWKPKVRFRPGSGPSVLLRKRARQRKNLFLKIFSQKQPDFDSDSLVKHLFSSL